jgi:hypothetical protein
MNDLPDYDLIFEYYKRDIKMKYSLQLENYRKEIAKRMGW